MFSFRETRQYPVINSILKWSVTVKVVSFFKMNGAPDEKGRRTSIFTLSIKICTHELLEDYQALAEERRENGAEYCRKSSF